MIFYKRFIGAIQAKTGHLSLIEFGAYDRLLDHCYSTGQALPLDIDTCCRIARAVTPAEKKAVLSVLAQFFVEQDGGYVQPRVLEELADAQPKICAAKENGKRGGRPKKEPNRNPMGSKTETQQEPSGFPEQNPIGFKNETQQEPSGKARQKQKYLSEERTGELKNYGSEDSLGAHSLEKKPPLPGNRDGNASPSAPPKPEKPEKTAAGTRLPDDWTLPDD